MTIANTDPNTGLDTLRIQPTGSGVANLEVAYEQMKVAGADDADVTDTARPTGNKPVEETLPEAHPG